MAMTPEEMITRYKMIEDTTDPRWSGDPGKRLWRSSRDRAGRPFGIWENFDGDLDAHIYDRDDPKCNAWLYVESWIHGTYRVVWIHPIHGATFTYCEGDLSLVMLADEESYAKELAGAAECYGCLP